jgi:ParB family chromosome partitioning protein
VSTSLSNISAARNALAKASTLEDVLTIRDKAEAIRIYVRAAAESLETQNAAAEIKLRAERKAGEMLAAMEKQDGGDAAKARPHHVTELPPSLKDLGITKMQSSRWQKEATVSDEVFEQLVSDCRDEQKELTQSLVLKAAGAGHVSQATGENEWYTPSEYIELARQCMGGIDIDPASCELAQSTVKAKRYYSIDEDGLRQDWNGRVWMNPPYSKDLCVLFINKLIDEIDYGRVTEACVLVNNATDTGWCQRLLEIAEAVCFVSGRIRIFDKAGKPANSPLQGQLVAYYGPDVGAFVQAFGRVGVCFVSNSFAEA